MMVSSSFVEKCVRTWNALQAGFIPVVATIATDGSGNALNINADTAAGEVKCALLFVLVLPLHPLRMKWICPLL